MWWFSIGLGLLSAALHWPIQDEPVARLKDVEAQPLSA
jgi:hypothetical protein